jgi:hypothetical protein
VQQLKGKYILRWNIREGGILEKVTAKGQVYFMAPHGDQSYPSSTTDHSPYRLDEKGQIGVSWYYSRKEIEENSPSRQDGIDLKKETYLRKSYCTFLQDLGMRLKV